MNKGDLFFQFITTPIERIPPTILKSTKIALADHILEIPLIVSKNKDDPQVIHQLSCFVGYHAYK